MDLLLEFGDSRKALHIEKESILSEIQREIRKFNQDVVVLGLTIMGLTKMLCFFSVTLIIGSLLSMSAVFMKLPECCAVQCRD